MVFSSTIFLFCFFPVVLILYYLPFIKSIKYKKIKEDGYSWYELAEYDEERYPNTNGVKLSYKYKTGAFTGSFKIYASNEYSVDDGKKPTLKKYTAKIAGCVVNGEGLGTVTVKIGKKTYTGTCSLQ